RDRRRLLRAHVHRRSRDHVLTRGRRAAQSVRVGLHANVTRREDAHAGRPRVRRGHDGSRAQELPRSRRSIARYADLGSATPAFTAFGSNCRSGMKSPGISAQARYEKPSNASPSPMEYCVAARPMSKGDNVEPMRPRLYAVPTAVPRTVDGKLS